MPVDFVTYYGLMVRNLPYIGWKNAAADPEKGGKIIDISLESKDMKERVKPRLLSKQSFDKVYACLGVFEQVLLTGNGLLNHY